MKIPIEDDLKSYYYELPTHLIAKHPASPRDSSRLLVLDRKKGSWSHHTFKEIINFLSPRDLLVANNTQVLKSRLLGRRLLNGQPSGKMEFFLLREIEPFKWEGLFHASARAAPGLKFQIPIPHSGWLKGRILSSTRDSKSGTVIAEFDQDPVASGAGMVPLPPYIKRELEPGDVADYQTVYAKKVGSAAVPTAGLHFTSEIFQELKNRSIHWEEITLHTGLGTFRPVKSENIRNHPMHEEFFEISEKVAERVNDWKNAGNRIVAVGTTSVRTLESAWIGNRLCPGRGRTSLFISPGHFHFQVVDALLTNFHFPESTLLMLVSAFAGRELVLEAYADAVREKYRFFSYGDAMLIL